MNLPVWRIKEHHSKVVIIEKRSLVRAFLESAFLILHTSPKTALILNFNAVT
jgi:hypothetical protein